MSASQRWNSKIWPLHHMVKLCEEICRQDTRIVITGTDDDLAYAETLIKNLKNAKVINACGKTTVNQLACLIKTCSVYISSDSAPLHIAASQGVPFIALFGPTDPLRHTPSAKNCLVIKKDLPCSPCYKSKCKSKKCMELIKPQDVLGAIEKLSK
jgi:ADP-heptose:LPS heptosyltransferase